MGYKGEYQELRLKLICGVSFLGIAHTHKSFSIV